METYFSQLWMLLDIMFAAILCSILGGEREKMDKPAGLRTNMIVGSISCFFVAISPDLSQFLIKNTEPDQLSMDAIRILQAIIVGVSFIGAGTILKSKNKNNVRNLTTASTLLYSAGIGISVALHLYVTAIGLAVLGLIINSLNTIWNFIIRIFKK
jgi:putative Mg2+ transporter-C (MgtC) family protein